MGVGGCFRVADVIVQDMGLGGLELGAEDDDVIGFGVGDSCQGKRFADESYLSATSPAMQ